MVGQIFTPAQNFFIWMNFKERKFDLTSIEGELTEPKHNGIQLN